MSACQLLSGILTPHSPALCELADIIKGKVCAIVQLQRRWVESYDRCREKYANARCFGARRMHNVIQLWARPASPPPFGERSKILNSLRASDLVWLPPTVHSNCSVRRPGCTTEGVRYNYYVQLVVIKRDWMRAANLDLSHRGGGSWS